MDASKKLKITANIAGGGGVAHLSSFCMSCSLYQQFAVKVLTPIPLSNIYLRHPFDDLVWKSPIDFSKIGKSKWP